MHEPCGSVTSQERQLLPDDSPYVRLMKRLNDIDDARDLCDSTYEVIEDLLSRPEDLAMLRSLSEMVGDTIGRIPFEGSPSQIQDGIKMAIKHCRLLLETAKQHRYPDATAQQADIPQEQPEARDVEYWLPPHLEHLLHRVEYVTPTLPPPQGGFGTFDELCQAAILERVDRILIFFQRHNPSIRTELPPIYLLSPEFAAKLRPAIIEFIYPHIRNSRQMRILSSEVDLSQTDTQLFWQSISKPLKAKLLAVWNTAWDQMKLIDAKQYDGTTVMQIRQNLKDFRACLEPTAPQDFDLPRIGNHEIDVFKSLLAPEIDWWSRLSTEWQRCQDLYEQEKDPRVFQQQAREGAFRDSLLATFQRFPSQWADFLALLCHRVFPRIDTSFLESFSVNFGKDVKQRAEHLPYLMRYLTMAHEHPEIKARERLEEQRWKDQTTALRTYLKNKSENDD